MCRKLTSIFVCVTFLSSLITPISYAQNVSSVLNLPIPGTMVSVSPTINLPLIKGMTIHPDNPLKFDFIIQHGDEPLTQSDLKVEAQKLIKYFFASLTVPEDEIWVNLSPYEKERMIPEELGQTPMGRDMLAQDYILKQLASSLIYPEDELGQKFWDHVRQKAKELYGTSKIPMNTFNKVWIVADKAVVYEHGTTALVVDSYLKVMMEEDYIALENNVIKGDNAPETATFTSEIIREIIIPEIEKEVNTGANFANLRQIFNAIILAGWFKQNLKQTLLGQVYVDQNKVLGIDLADKTVKEKIYNQYLEAYKKGAYNYIKEDIDALTQQIIPRKYFSGGQELAVLDSAVLTTLDRGSPAARPAVESLNTAADDDKVILVTVEAAAVDPSTASVAQTEAASVTSAASQTENRFASAVVGHNGDLTDAVINVVQDENGVRHVGVFVRDLEKGYIVHQAERGFQTELSTQGVLERTLAALSERSGGQRGNVFLSQSPETAQEFVDSLSFSDAATMGDFDRRRIEMIVGVLEQARSALAKTPETETGFVFLFEHSNFGFALVRFLGGEIADILSSQFELDIVSEDTGVAGDHRMVLRFANDGDGGRTSDGDNTPENLARLRAAAHDLIEGYLQAYQTLRDFEREVYNQTQARFREIRNRSGEERNLARAHEVLDEIGERDATPGKRYAKQNIIAVIEVWMGEVDSVLQGSYDLDGLNTEVRELNAQRDAMDWNRFLQRARGFIRRLQTILYNDVRQDMARDQGVILRARFSSHPQSFVLPALELEGQRDAIAAANDDGRDVFYSTESKQAYPIADQAVLDGDNPIQAAAFDLDFARWQVRTFTGDAGRKAREDRLKDALEEYRRVLGFVISEDDDAATLGLRAKEIEQVLKVLRGFRSRLRRDIKGPVFVQDEHTPEWMNFLWDDVQRILTARMDVVVAVRRVNYGYGAQMVIQIGEDVNSSRNRELRTYARIIADALNDAYEQLLTFTRRVAEQEIKIYKAIGQGKDENYFGTAHRQLRDIIDEERRDRRVDAPVGSLAADAISLVSMHAMMDKLNVWENEHSRDYLPLFKGRVQAIQDLVDLGAKRYRDALEAAHQLIRDLKQAIHRRVRQEIGATTIIFVPGYHLEEDDLLIPEELNGPDGERQRIAEAVRRDQYHYFSLETNKAYIIVYDSAQSADDLDAAEVTQVDIIILPQEFEGFEYSVLDNETRRILQSARERRGRIQDTVRGYRLSSVVDRLSSDRKALASLESSSQDALQQRQRQVRQDLELVNAIAARNLAYAFSDRVWFAESERDGPVTITIEDDVLIVGTVRIPIEDNPRELFNRVQQSLRAHYEFDREFGHVVFIRESFFPGTSMNEYRLRQALAPVYAQAESGPYTIVLDRQEFHRYDDLPRTDGEERERGFGSRIITDLVADAIVYGQYGFQVRIIAHDKDVLYLTTDLALLEDGDKVDAAIMRELEHEGRKVSFSVEEGDRPDAVDVVATGQGQNGPRRVTFTLTGHSDDRVFAAVNDVLDQRLKGDPGVSLVMGLEEAAKQLLPAGSDSAQAVRDENKFTKGGIDITQFDMHIKRDPNGNPLPVEMQPITEIQQQMKGVVPFIIDWKPLTPLTFPLLSEITNEIFDHETTEKNTNPESKQQPSAFLDQKHKARKLELTNA